MVLIHRTELMLSLIKVSVLIKLKMYNFMEQKWVVVGQSVGTWAEKQMVLGLSPSAVKMWKVIEEGA